MSASAELDLCYVEATELIRGAVEHVLSKECDESLKAELVRWREAKPELRETGQEGPEYCWQEGTPIQFDLVLKVHQQLKIHPLESGPVYIHELVKGSSLCFPQVKLPSRNAELVARLERVKAMTDNKEYKRMVKNVDVSRSNSEFYSLGLEVQAANKQIWALLNFLLTVVGSFVFGFFVGYYAGYSTPVCVCVGLIFGTVVFMADLYFIVRTDLVSPKHSQKDSKHKLKKD